MIDDEDEPAGELLTLTVAAAEAGERLDRVLAAKTELSRARLQTLIGEGALSLDGQTVSDASAKARMGDYRLRVPPPRAAEPEPEAIPLDVLFEDDELLVVDKPAGMAAHPAPGSETGTLVNAVLHHAAGRLSGIGGVMRPGIVHRLDKDTSGIMVVAKTDRAHQGLAALWAVHDIERAYLALTRGAPEPRWGDTETLIGRHPADRKKMAVLKTGGRRALTRHHTEVTWGPAERPLAARVRCRLETGRTHQIRVHLAYRGAPCLGDALYGSGPPAAPVRAAVAESGLKRQALHAAVLGFVHPVTGEALRFETPPPEDMRRLETLLAALD